MVRHSLIYQSFAQLLELFSLFEGALHVAGNYKSPVPCHQERIDVRVVPDFDLNISDQLLRPRQSVFCTRSKTHIPALCCECGCIILVRVDYEVHIVAECICCSMDTLLAARLDIAFP